MSFRWNQKKWELLKTIQPPHIIWHDWYLCQATLSRGATKVLFLAQLSNWWGWATDSPCKNLFICLCFSCKFRFSGSACIVCSCYCNIRPEEVAQAPFCCEKQVPWVSPKQSLSVQILFTHEIVIPYNQECGHASCHFGNGVYVCVCVWERERVCVCFPCTHEAIQIYVHACMKNKGMCVCKCTDTHIQWSKYKYVHTTYMDVVCVESS